MDGEFLLELRPEDLHDVLGVEHQLHIRKIIISRDKLMDGCVVRVYVYVCGGEGMGSVLSASDGGCLL